jgi:hypothetical protein
MDRIEETREFIEEVIINWLLSAELTGLSGSLKKEYKQ